MKTQEKNETEESQVKSKPEPTKQVPPKQHLGASQFAAALGLNQFLAPDALKCQLEKGYVWEGNPRISFGHNKEKLGKYFYQKITGNKIRRAYMVRDLKHPRLVGICDGLIGQEGGLEIKCHYQKDHPLKSVPIYYLPQIAGYLHLYNKCWWDFMSCCFNDQDEICRCRIIRVYREDVQDAWEQEWYPKLLEYIGDISWAEPPKPKPKARKSNQLKKSNPNKTK